MLSKEEFVEACLDLVPEGETYFIPQIFKDENGELYEIDEGQSPAEFEAARLYDFLVENSLAISEEKAVVEGPTTMSEILLVEDGSVEVDELVEQGFHVIVYRAGSTPPRFIEPIR